MSLHTVQVNGEKHIVEAPSKSAAGAWANKQATVKVELSTKADIEGVDLNSVPVILKGGLTQAESDAADKAKADKEAAAAKAKAEKGNKTAPL